MRKPRQIRTYDYVNHPYEEVRDRLVGDPLPTLREATHAARNRAHAVAVALRVNIAGVDLGKEVSVTVGRPVELPAELGKQPLTRIPILWEAVSGQRLFPLMKGELTLYPISATETQLDFGGTYEPPMGPLGGVLDSVVGHRIADASIHRFLADVAHYLRSTMVPQQD